MHTIVCNLHNIVKHKTRTKQSLRALLTTTKLKFPGACVYLSLILAPWRKSPSFALQMVNDGMGCGGFRPNNKIRRAQFTLQLLPPGHYCSVKIGHAATIFIYP